MRFKRFSPMAVKDEITRIHEIEKAANKRVKEAEAKAEEIKQNIDSEAEEILQEAEERLKKSIQKLEEEYEEKRKVIEHEIGLKADKTLDILESFANQGKDAAILAVVKIILDEE
jgi:vacuolar-type H+-ATPase subunit H